LIITLSATDFFKIKAVIEIELSLKNQLIISTVLMIVGIAIDSWMAPPSSFTIFNFRTQEVVENWQLFLCVVVGLWAGLIMGLVVEYYTSNVYSPIQEDFDSCPTGAATNAVFRLAMGYKSVIIPILALAINIFARFSLVTKYGIVVAALEILSTIATRLTINGYSPISDHARGIAEMAGMNPKIRERPHALNIVGIRGVKKNRPTD
jgi:inorganic pyrophosphatase